MKRRAPRYTPPPPQPGNFTVETVNRALGSRRYVGSFETREDAEVYAITEASRCRSFVEFQVWKGSPRNPLGPVGVVHKGAH